MAMPRVVVVKRMGILLGGSNGPAGEILRARDGIVTLSMLRMPNVHMV